MEELFNLGISENTIKTMFEMNPSIKELTEKEVQEKENLLKK